MDYKGCTRIGEGHLDLTQCGAKAFRQHALKAKGFLVPEGIIIDYEQTDWLIREWKLQAKDAFSNTVEKIKASPGANGFLESVLDLFPKGKPLILRSAPSIEDHPDYAMAGQFLSAPGITSLEALQQALAQAWTTAKSKNIEGLQLSFLIQEYVSTSLGGVTFTVSPTDPKADEMALELIQGSCAQLTAGHSPDGHLVFNWNSKTLSKPIPQALSDQITTEQLIQYGITFLNIQKHYGCPQDIEWGICNGELYIFQSRPVTRIQFPADIIWTNANFRDGGIGAEMPSPLMWDLYKRTFDHSIAAFSKRYHIRPDAPPKSWSRTFLGYPYWNLTATKSGARKVLGYVERQFDEGQGVTPYYEGNGEVTKLTLKSIFTSIRALLAIRTSIKNRTKICQQTKSYFEHEVRQAFETRPDERASLAEHHHFFEELVTRHLMYIYTNYWEIIYDNTFVSTFTQNALARYNRQTGANLQFTAVTAGLEGVAHLRPLNALQELAERIRSDRPSLHWWQAQGADGILRNWNNGTDFPYRPELSIFLDKYGHKSARELEISFPNWAEAPMAVLHTLQQYLSAGIPTDTRQSQPRNQAIRSGLPNRLARQIELQRSILWWKEEIRDITTQLFHYIRIAAVALGKKLAAEQLLSNHEEVFFLTHREILDLTQQNVGTAHFREQINYRKQLRKSLCNYQKPDIIFPNPVMAMSRNSSDLKGVGVCQGIIQCHAVVIADITGHYDPAVLEDCILVTEYINPGHLPHFAKIKGLVTANGGLLSHAAIICRELNIPAVFGIPKVIHKIQDGAFIQLNGKTGEVIILAE